MNVNGATVLIFEFPSQTKDSHFEGFIFFHVLSSVFATSQMPLWDHKYIYLSHDFLNASATAQMLMILANTDPLRNCYRKPWKCGKLFRVLKSVFFSLTRLIFQSRVRGKSKIATVMVGAVFFWLLHISYFVSWWLIVRELLPRDFFIDNLAGCGFVVPAAWLSDVSAFLRNCRLPKGRA